QQAFFGLIGVALLLQVVQALAAFVNALSTGYFAARCRVLATDTLFQRILSFSFSCASSYRVGDLNTYMTQASTSVTSQIRSFSDLFSTGLLCAAYLVVLMTISPWLLVAVALIAAMIGLVQKQLLPRILRGAARVTQDEVALNSRVTEDLQGLRLLHTSGHLEATGQRVRALLVPLEAALRGQVRRLAVVGPVSGVLPMLAIAAIAALSLLLFNNRATGVLPSLVTFVIALQRLNARLGGLANTWNTLAANSADLNRLNTILTTDDKQFRRVGGQPFSGLERELRFEAVGLRYAPDLPPALTEISFTLPKGQMLALVGPSGAGKSSIADLLTGLYAPSAGRIWIDNTPLEQLELASWQQRLGVVSQDTFLFNATIAENIAFGTPGATPAQIQAACQAAQAAGFIESLPQGYDTLVGERGYRLSGGQRQRLSLARAILRQPELLILDEATSALDSQSERLVQEAIERFERHHTVLVIAHRLSTIVRADQILVLDQGRIVEQGNHPLLLSQKGLYASLWEQQSTVPSCYLKSGMGRSH
ncbi:MAG: ABC transporter ATP-binding protein, partial [Cyanobacteriota bacterium]|nr:ABC transporter ATP-binding protein [Cyanobacteriota bacterium]